MPQNIMEQIDSFYGDANQNLIDFICLKGKADKLEIATYYLDGHPEYEKSITLADMDFLKVSRAIGCYGNSEKIIDDELSDRFYVRVNVTNETQQKYLLSFLTLQMSLTSRQKDLLQFLSGLDNCILTDDTRDYKSLYYCGFSMRKDSACYSNIRFYFKTFGADESVRHDEECIRYLGQNSHIAADPAYQIVENALEQEKAGLRCIGAELGENGTIKIKYYLCAREDDTTLLNLLQKINRKRQFQNAAAPLIKSLPQVHNLKCVWLQITSGLHIGDGSINMYLENKKVHQTTVFYSLREGLVLREIGGIYFLIDIHEKNYYDTENLLFINEIGKAIISYLSINGVSSLNGIVSFVKSLLIDYTPEMYTTIYSDCTEYMKQLCSNGYVMEVN